MSPGAMAKAIGNPTAAIEPKRSELGDGVGDRLRADRCPEQREPEEDVELVGLEEPRSSPPVSSVLTMTMKLTKKATYAHWRRTARNGIPADR